MFVLFQSTKEKVEQDTSLVNKLNSLAKKSQTLKADSVNIARQKMEIEAQIVTLQKADLRSKKVKENSEILLTAHGEWADALIFYQLKTKDEKGNPTLSSRIGNIVEIKRSKEDSSLLEYVIVRHGGAFGVEDAWLSKKIQDGTKIMTGAMENVVYLKKDLEVEIEAWGELNHIENRIRGKIDGTYRSEKLEEQYIRVKLQNDKSGFQNIVTVKVSEIATLKVFNEK